MQFYGISVMHLYKQSGRWKDVFDNINVESVHFVGTYNKIYQNARFKKRKATISIAGARGGVVVKTLRYKPAGRGFDFPWCHWNFSVP